MLVQLNAFLLRLGVNPINAIGDLKKNPPQMYHRSDSDLIELSTDDADLLEAAVDGDMIVMLFRRPGSTPRWKTLLAQNFGLQFSRGSESEGAIVFVAVSDEALPTGSTRWVAWCFGTGSRILARSASDPRFGLLVALNLIVRPVNEEGDSSRSTERPRAAQFSDLRYRTTAPFFQQTGHRAARGLPIEGFRVDRGADLVAAVGGRTARSTLSSSVLGGRSLRFRADVENVNILHDFSHATLNSSHSQDYRDTLQWIDNIRPVDDSERAAALRQELAGLLLESPIPSNVDAILPDDLLEADESRVIRYILYPLERKSNAAAQNMSIDRVAFHIRKGADLSDSVRLLDSTLRFVDDAGDIVGTATVLECICADFISPSDGEQYMIYDRDFYRVDAGFIASIDREVAGLPLTDIVFPDYRAETEPDYLARVGSEACSEFVVLDRALIRLEGEAGIEASDLVSPEGAMIHLKRKGKSSTLSHLFLQAANSCEMLRRSAAARAKLAQFVSENAADARLAEKINAVHADLLPHRGEVEVVIAFLGNWRNRTANNLPLFSRISLIHESRRMQALGYRPSIALISCF